MIKVIIFDADGVLMPHSRRFSVLLSEDFGIPLEKSAGFFNGPFQDCLIGKADLRDTVSMYLDSWGWDKGVDAFLDASAHLGHKKPDQEFFAKILKDLKNIKKEEILFWDDDAKNVKGAKDFGINAEFYINIEHFRQRMKEYGVSNELKIEIQKIKPV